MKLNICKQLLIKRNSLFFIKFLGLCKSIVKQGTYPLYHTGMDIYLNDKRTPCKYGENCYQKNPHHIKKFKHPPKDKEDSESPPPKKLKLVIEGEKESPKEKIENIEKEGEEESPKENLENKLESSKTVPGRLSLYHVDVPCILLMQILQLHLLVINTSDFSKLNYFTVIVGKKDEYHIGYFRDDPLEEPIFLASMSSKSGTIQPLKEDLFSTVYYYIKNVYKGNSPQKNDLLKAVKDFAEEKGYKLDYVSDRLKKRRKSVVSKAFHGAGIVVPVNKDTDVGYREIPETNANLKKIFKNVVEAGTEEKKLKCLDVLQELMTNAQWATDEGDFGMGLELGLDLFTFGGEEFHSFIRHLLTVAYDLLNREAFSKIIQAHLKNRRKGANQSSFNENV
ncbi:Histone PARylation factor 1 [Armadillidium nasatum]|uniref:Histone PARylation factor 1 n=1 Tax=Armadillidium nasatum TaxID=96803 RepID=A0A5N5SWP4_9CRUS|nr:Histone PARylation factor 1 [Armadillidium nasatum]